MLELLMISLMIVCINIFVCIADAIWFYNTNEVLLRFLVAVNATIAIACGWLVLLSGLRIDVVIDK